MSETGAAQDAGRALCDIADDITAHWRRPYFAAAPYIEAMRHLGPIDGTYGHEDAADIIARFLNAASTWRGEDARRVKAELRAMLENARGARR